MSSGPIKAEDISDELHNKIAQLLLRKALGKQGMADILNAAIGDGAASPPVYKIRRRNNLNLIGLGDKEAAIKYEAYYPSTFAEHWKGEKI